MLARRTFVGGAAAAALTTRAAAAPPPGRTEAAKALGVIVPPSLLVQANRVLP